MALQPHAGNDAEDTEDSAERSSASLCSAFSGGIFIAKSVESPPLLPPYARSYTSACASETRIGGGAYSHEAVIATQSAAAPPSLVSCDSIIYIPEGVQATRIVLGVVSVPDRYLLHVEHSAQRPWPYFRKAGLAIRGAARRSPVAVPRSWRKRVAIQWGNSGAVSALQFEHCPRRRRWNPYAGGFSLRSTSACVPLTFSVGERSTIVRFGIGRRCP
jgi:hypothetical protein